MTIGTSLFLIAVGAILKFAVADEVEGVDLSTIGLILIVIGIVGLVLGMFLMNRPARGETVITRERDPRDPRL